MSKWKNVRTYMEVNPYTGQPKSEDAPANATGSMLLVLVTIHQWLW